MRMISGGQISKHGKKVGGSGKGPILFDRDIILRKRGGDIQLHAHVSTGALVANGHFTAHNGTHNGHVSANGNFTVYTTADGTTSKFTVTSTSGDVVAAGYVTSESDRRLKKDIVDIEHAVETVKSLQGVKYKFKEGDDKERIGLIAQDVEPYVPQVVFEKEDDGMKSVSYQSLVALLIEAVKEQQKEIDELKAQVWLSR